MTVRSFPAPEPWPAEFFDEFGLADLVQLARDLDAVIAERQKGDAMTAQPNPLPCTCGGGGVCNRCEQDSLGLEASLMVRALERTEQALLAPVIPLDRHSVRAPKDAA